MPGCRQAQATVCTLHAAQLTAAARAAERGVRCTRHIQHSHSTSASSLVASSTASWQAASRHLQGQARSHLASSHHKPAQQQTQKLLRPAHAPAARRSSSSQAGKTAKQSTTKTAVAAVASKASVSGASGAATAGSQPPAAAIPAAVKSVLSPSEIYQQVS